MVLKNLKIILEDKIIENGFITIENGVITSINEGETQEEGIDYQGLTVMPGFIDIHIHGSKGIDFMDATKDDYKVIAESLYQEGVTTFLATTLTSDTESLKRVCEIVKEVKDEVPALGGIHFEGPYINVKLKGAQNEGFIRLPNIVEFDELQKISGNNIRLISLAPEATGAYEFISHVTSNGVTVSAGHSDATFNEVEEAIKHGLTNTTHTHNAMSGHHHRKPGIVTAAFYFDSLYTEFICDTIHVSKETLKTSYKIIGPERFIIVTDALKAKHSDIDTFQLFGLDCIRKDGAAYLSTGPLAGSLLTMDQGVRNIRDITGENLINLSKISSRNAAKSLNLHDRGVIQVGKLADLVIVDNDLNVKATYKLGKKVF